jgi:HEPN domain-containing protein
MVHNKKVSFDPQYALELLNIARGDLVTAKALLDAQNPGRLENILYMIQQSVEKAFKAVLIAKQIQFPLVHDLGILIALLPSQDYPPGGFDWTALNPFASIRRYESGPMPLDREEIVGAYDAALLVLAWADQFVTVKK